MRTFRFILLVLALFWSAVGIAWLLPRPTTAYDRIAAELPDTPTAMQLRVAVNSGASILLTDDDVLAWQGLRAQGVAPAEALRCIIEYRRAVLRATP